MRFFTSSKTKNLPRDAKKSLAPRQEFVAQGKERFLAAFDASEGARNARRSVAERPTYISAFFKVGIGALAMFCVGVGLSAYADTANVSATNPLYPLKRLSENVQVALAPASEKPQLQATFAVRRADEIAALQVAAPSSTLIPQLTSDLDQDINTSLGALAENTSTGGGEATSSTSSIIMAATLATSSPVVASTSADEGSLGVYCNAFDVSTSGVLIGHLEATLAHRANGFAEFNEQCDSASSSGRPASFIPPTSQSRYGGTRHDHHLLGGSATSSPIHADDSDVAVTSTLDL